VEKTNVRFLPAHRVVGSKNKPIIVPQSLFKLYACEMEKDLFDIWAFKVPNNREIDEDFNKFKPDCMQDEDAQHKDKVRMIKMFKVSQQGVVYI